MTEERPWFWCPVTQQPKQMNADPPFPNARPSSPDDRDPAPNLNPYLQEHTPKPHTPNAFQILLAWAVLAVFVIPWTALWVTHIVTYNASNALLILHKRIETIIFNE